MGFRLCFAAAIVAVTGASLCDVGCAQVAAKNPKADAGETYEEDPGQPVLAPPRDPDYTNDDSGAFNLGSRPGDGPGDAAPRVDDASAPDARLPDGGYAPCTGPLQAGDLKIVEIMIASQSGSGDRGEWVEIQSTKQCRLNVNGVRVESPRGTTSTDAVTVTNELILEPNGTFVVAGSADPTVNHGLPAPVYAWNAADVLKNDGDTVSVLSGATVLDSITYPSFAPIDYGRSISFPADCAWSDRPSWARWSYSFTQYASGPDGGVFLGTPNADNGDVACY